MATNKQMEQSQDSERTSASLDRRYGKIGIAAVAGAVQKKAEQPNEVRPRRFSYESEIE